MSRLQTVMARAPAAPAKPATARPGAVRVATAATHREPVHDVQTSLLRVRIVWFAMLANAFIIPALLVLIAATYDVVAWKASIGAFIIAAGAISIGISFPFADQFRHTNNELVKEYERSRRYDEARTAKLMKLLFIGAFCAELPSIAGLVHFFATRELIASLLLCAPAIGLMLVAYQPVEWRPGSRPAPAESESEDAS